MNRKNLIKNLKKHKNRNIHLNIMKHNIFFMVLEIKNSIFITEKYKNSQMKRQE